MSTIVATIRFSDGTKMFAQYQTTADVLSRALFTTEEEAANRPEFSARKPPENVVELGEEEVYVIPYASKGDNEIKFVSRASREASWITGPTSMTEVDDEHKTNNFFA